MSSLSSTHLVLFMTRGVSLAQWERQGLFEREVALYRALRPRLAGISFVTYGDYRDLAFAERLPGIEILPNRWGLPGPLYAALIPRLHRQSLARAGLLKTNQIKGAEVALATKAVTGAQLIARCGYVWSEFVTHDRPGLRRVLTLALAVRRERAAFTHAEAVSVTTAQARQYVIDRYAVSPTKIHVIPNYVRDEFFALPLHRSRTGRRVIFIGRLESQKNPAAVIEAAHGLDIEVRMIGQGSLRAALERQAHNLGVPVQFLPAVPHLELAGLLQACDVMILPSTFEGHPKTLIEAMAAGLAIVGTNAPGVREIIRSGETGLVAENDPAAFRDALARLLADGELRSQLGRNAREFTREHFSFSRILAAEIALLKEMAETNSNVA